MQRFPIGMFIVRKYGQSRYNLWFGLIAAISIVYQCLGRGVPSAATFYLAPTRAWELLLGSLMAAGAGPSLESRMLRDGLSVSRSGSSLADPGIFQDNAISGPRRASPTLGAAVLIHAGNCGDSWVKRALRWKPLYQVPSIKTREPIVVVQWT